MNLADHTLLLYMTGQNLVFFLLLKSYFTADQVLNLLEKIKILLFSLYCALRQKVLTSEVKVDLQLTCSPFNVRHS